jgi:hypothetical protein
MKNETTNEKTTYAGQPLQVGDKVGVRYHSDIKPGTVIKATASKVTIQLHSFKLLNGPESGEPDAMTVTVGGFCAHWEGRQRNEIDETSNDGTVTATFRKGDMLNGQTGIWRQTGYTGGRGKLGGVIYNGLVAYHDYNF